MFGGAVPKAVVEFDMFGSSEFQPTGSYGDVSIIPRIRVAYAELNWGNGSTIIQIGQQNMLTIGTIPQSLSHIAFPATYAAGTVGWRQPGIWGWHTFGDDLKFEFAWSIQKSGWANTVAARRPERRLHRRHPGLRGPRQGQLRQELGLLDLRPLADGRPQRPNGVVTPTS